MTKVCLVAAVATNGIIGRNNTLPWRTPTDLKWFKYLTKNQIVVMGRKTWDSLPKKPLPNRFNIVVSTTLTMPDETIANTIFAPSIEIAIQRAWDIAEIFEVENIFVIGGVSLYNAIFQTVDEMYITHIDAAPGGDVVFPLDLSNADLHWNINFTGTTSVDDVDEYPFVVKHYTRK